MACDIKSAHVNAREKAANIFGDKSASIEWDANARRATVRWGTIMIGPKKDIPFETKVKGRNNAYKMILRKMDLVRNWATETFGLDENGKPFEFVKFDGQDPESFTVKIEIPEEIHKKWVIQFAAQGDPAAIDIIQKNPSRYNFGGPLPGFNNDLPTTFYQTENEGKTRLKDSLEAAVIKFLNDNGISNNTSPDGFKNLEEYAKDYEIRFGRKLNAVALADITNNIALWSTNEKEIDGTTLLEEAVHFITYHLWETEELKLIRDLINPDTGMYWLDSTKEYAENYEKYLKIYSEELESNKNLDEAARTKIARDKALQEVVTKILTNFIYNRYYEGEYNTSRFNSRATNLIKNFFSFVSALFRTIKKNGIKKVFSKKAIRENMVAESFPSEIKAILTSFSDSFAAGELILSKRTAAITGLENIKKTDSVTTNKLYSKAVSALRRLESERKQILNKIRVNAQKHVLARAEVIREKYQSLFPDLDSVEAIQGVIEVIFAKYNDTSTLLTFEEIETLKEQMRDLTELKHLFTDSQKDARLAQELRDLGETVQKMDWQLKNKKLGVILNYYLFGETRVNDDGTTTVTASVLENTLKKYEELRNAYAKYEDYVNDPDEMRALYNDAPVNSIWRAISDSHDFQKTHGPLIEEMYGLVSHLDATRKATGKLPDDSPFSDSEVDVYLEELKNATQALKSLSELQQTAYREGVVKNSLMRETLYDEEGNVMRISQDILDQHINDIQVDMNYMERYIGAMTQMSQWQVQATLKRWNQIQNNTLREVNGEMLNLRGFIQASDLNNDPELKSILNRLAKKLKLENKSLPTGWKVEHLINEFDENGYPTGYMMGPYNRGKFEKQKEKHNQWVLDKLEKEIESLTGRHIKIPRGNDAESRTMRNKLIFDNEDIYLTYADKETTKNPIADRHKELWREFYEVNTQEKPDWREIIEAKRLELSEAEFRLWYEENTRTYINKKTGNITVYPSGELVIPGEHFRNEIYEELMKSDKFREYWGRYKGIKDYADSQLPVVVTSNSAFRDQLPQISMNTWEVIYQVKNLRRKFVQTLKNTGIRLWDLITDGFIAKPDDEIFSTSISTSVSDELPLTYMPPIRFVRKIENPKNLSLDAVGNLAIYLDMALNYNGITKSLPFFAAVRNAAAQESFVNNKLSMLNPGSRDTYKWAFSKNRNLDDRETRSIVEKNLLQGQDSLTYDYLLKFAENKLYGQSLADFNLAGIPITKASETLLRHVKRVNLLFNSPAQATGFIETLRGQIDNYIINRAISRDSLNFAWKEVLTNLKSMLADYESPLKTNKYTSLMQHLEIIDSGRDYHTNADQSRFYRVVTGVLSFGGWRAADYVPKTVTFIGVAKSYRYINGKWYTWEQWRENKGTRSEWIANENNSFLEKSRLVRDSKANRYKLEFDPEVTNADKDFISNMSRSLNRDIASEPTVFDYNYAAHNLILRWVFMHKSFFTLGMMKMFKGTHVNFLTERVESGIIRNSLIAMPIGALVGSKDYFSWVDFKNTVLYGSESIPEYKREAVKRSIMIPIWANIMGWLAISVINMFEDCDDAWCNWIKYVALRSYEEAMTWMDHVEAWEIAMRPVAGGNITQLSQLVPFIDPKNAWNANELAKGKSAYETRAGKVIANVLPGKKFFETFPAEKPFGINAPVDRAKYLELQTNWLRSHANKNLASTPSWHGFRNEDFEDSFD